MRIDQPGRAYDTAAIATQNNRKATVEGHAPRPDSLVDRYLTEDDIRTLEGAYGYEMARPPSAGVMPMAAQFYAKARVSVSRGDATSLLDALRTMQAHGAPISDALLAAVANRKDTDDSQARAYLAAHTARDFFV